MNLIDLYNGMQKTASSVSRQPDEWDRVAASVGMSTEQYIEKTAEAVAYEEAELTKTAQESAILGEAMSEGYWDALSKYASAHPVRDGVPEVFSKIASAAKQALTANLIAVSTKQR